MTKFTDSTDFASDKLIGTVEAARLLGVGRSTIQRWIDAEKLEAHRTVGGHRRIKEDDLLAFAFERGIPVKQSQAAGDDYRILVVDDDVEVRELISGVFEQQRTDIEVITVSNGFDAGIAVYKYTPGLVFLDIQMPEMDGIAVCLSIREIPEMAQSSIIGITGLKDEEEIKKLIDVGAEKVLRKPLDPQDLLQIALVKFPISRSARQ